MTKIEKMREYCSSRFGCGGCEYFDECQLLTVNPCSLKNRDIERLVESTEEIEITGLEAMREFCKKAKFCEMKGRGCPFEFKQVCRLIRDLPLDLTNEDIAKLVELVQEVDDERI